MEITKSGQDPENIELTFRRPENEEQYQVAFSDLDEFMKTSLLYGMFHGVVIGACTTVLFVLWIVTHNKRTPIFILNQSSMLFNVLRSALFMCWLRGPLSLLSFGFTGILTDKTLSKYSISTASNVMQVLLVACVEASTIYQINVIFRSPEVKRIGMALTGLGSLMGVTVVSFYIASCVVNVKKTHQKITNNETEATSWLLDIPFILFSVSILLMSLVLTAKLFFAIRSRRYLGLKQFSSFHILFIMSCQVMIVPSILFLVNYGVDSAKDNLLGSTSTLLVVLSLPLSSMWATAANNHTKTSLNSNALFESKTLTTSEATSATTQFSFFPDKLEKSTSSPSSTNYCPQLPQTLTSTKVPYSGDPFMHDLEKCVSNEASLNDSKIKSLQPAKDKDYFADLNNTSNDNFVSVTTHHYNA